MKLKKRRKRNKRRRERYIGRNRGIARTTWTTRTSKSLFMRQ